MPHARDGPPWVAQQVPLAADDGKGGGDGDLHAYQGMDLEAFGKRSRELPRLAAASVQVRGRRVVAQTPADCAASVIRYTTVDFGRTKKRRP